MDDPDLPLDVMSRTLHTLAALNRLTLARRILARACRGQRILDVATGGGDIARYLSDRQVGSTVVGLDRHARVLDVARGHGQGVSLVQGDANRMPFADRSFDTAFCHLLAHHLEPAQLTNVIREMGRVARRVVVLDLCRDRRLYAAVWLLTRFSPSAVARHDGPVSVRRAYRPGEAAELGAAAGLQTRVERVLGWRWLMIAEATRGIDPGRPGTRRAPGANRATC